jgi:hypothetical protein
MGWHELARNPRSAWTGGQGLDGGGGKRADPEACSMVIIETVWALLQPQ